MKFEPENIFHVYNRGNNKARIFFRHENYLFFLQKVRKELLPYCEILCYCLMPNHFHFLVYVKSLLTLDSNKKHLLNDGFAILLRSYTRAINKQEKRTGSLFQQKTKAKCLTYNQDTGKKLPSIYPIICFHYLHQNPYKAGLFKKMENWEFSSFVDYIGMRNGTLCNQELAKQILDLPDDRGEFYKASYELISPAQMEKLY